MEQIKKFIACRRMAFCVLLLCLCTLAVSAQPNYSNDRQQEKLGRGLVAFNTANYTTFVSWRYFSHEAGYKYQLYRNGEKMVETQKTHHVLPVESRATDTYYVKVLDAAGKEVETTESVSPYTTGYIKVPLTKPSSTVNNNSKSYTPNDISVGDVDGDGEYEFIVKWDPDDSRDSGKDGKSSNAVIDCYKLDGTRLWSINLGPNIRAGAHYTQFLVYDFDDDGKAEMICKTAPQSKDGQGNYVSKASDDNDIKNCSNTTSYRNSKGHITDGPEFLTVFDGQTGAAIHTIWYNPNRACEVALTSKPSSYTYNTNAWKPSDKSDSYNRGERYNASVAYLDGLHPTAIFQRGYYTRAYIWAVDFKDKKLVHRWLHASVSNTQVEHYDANWTKTTKTYSSNTCGKGSHYTAYGNGNHQIAVGDYDGDGYDEITLGQAAIDHDGKLMYAVGYGHGDAMHIGDLIPSNPGLEVFCVHEESISGSAYGWDVHDAKTGKVIWSATGSEDNGRGMAADLISTNVGYEFSSSNDRKQRSATTGEVVSEKSSSMNFRLYWDGTLQDNLADGGLNDEPYVITRWDGSSFQTVTSLEGNSCNDTKRTPNLSADIFGDWREEVILHDDSNLYIHMSPERTDYNVPCLMTDHIYRMGITWQQSSYNQPPHLGYYLPQAETNVDLSKAEDELFYDPSELASDGVQREEIGEGDIVWAFSTASADDTPTYSEVFNGFISPVPIEIGSNLEFSTTLKTNDEKYTESVFVPKTKQTGPDESNTVKFFVQLEEGYEFVPTNVSFVATRIGTDGGFIEATWVSSDGITKTLVPATTPDRNNATPNYSFIESPFETAKASTGKIGVVFNIYGLNGKDADSPKEMGLCNITISGKLYKSGSTGIRTVRDATISASPYYNLQGQRVTTPKKGNVYIKDGKKVVY